MNREAHTTDLDTEEEIDLAELIKTIWRAKVLVFMTTLLMFSCGLYYINTMTNPQYRAYSIFNLKTPAGQSKMAGINSLSGMIGLGDLSSSSSQNVYDQINGADFLRQVIKKLELSSDPEFFSEISNGKVSWYANQKLRLKQFLLPNNEELVLTQSRILDLVTDVFRSKFTLKESKNGAYIISFQSVSSDKAAFISNFIMKEFLDVHRQTEISKNELSLSYLKETLTKAKNDLDEATDKVEKFMLEQNMLSSRDFQSQANRLKVFRDKITVIEATIVELNSLKNALSKIIGTIPKLDASKMSSNEQGSSIKEQIKRLYSIAPRIRATVLSQTSRNPSNLKLVLEILEIAIPTEISRQSRALKATITGYEKLAKRAKASSLSARKLAAFSGDAEAKALIFKSLVQQVSSNQITDGFRENLGVIYETATPPMFPISPKKKTILIFLIGVGLILGSSLSLLMNLLSKKVWSKKKLKILEDDCEVNEMSGYLYNTDRLSPFPFSKRKRWSSNSDLFKLNKICYQLNQTASKIPKTKQFICIVNFGAGALTEVCLILGKVFAENGRSIILLDMTYKNRLSKNRLIKNLSRAQGPVNTIKLFDNIAYKRLEPPKESHLKTEFRSKIETLKTEYSQSYDVVISIVDCVEDENVSVTEVFNSDSLLFLTKAGQLTEQNISTIKSILNQKVLTFASVLFFRD